MTMKMIAKIMASSHSRSVLFFFPDGFSPRFRARLVARASRCLRRAALDWGSVNSVTVRLGLCSGLRRSDLRASM